MNQLFELSDYPACVALVTLGYRLIGVDKSKPNRAIFQFEKDEGIQQALESFFRDELRMNPRLILMNARVVKDRLHGGY